MTSRQLHFTANGEWCGDPIALPATVRALQPLASVEFPATVVLDFEARALLSTLSSSSTHDGSTGASSTSSVAAAVRQQKEQRTVQRCIADLGVCGGVVTSQYPAGVVVSLPPHDTVLRAPVVTMQRSSVPSLRKVALVTSTLAGCCLTHGVYCFSVRVVSSGPARVGWAEAVWNARDARDNAAVGDDVQSWGFGASGPHAGSFHHAGAATAWGKGWRDGDLLSCFVDVDAGALWYTLNGESMGVAARGIRVGVGLSPAVSIGHGFVGAFDFAACGGDGGSGGGGGGGGGGGDAPARSVQSWFAGHAATATASASLP
jgi:hypothetical protein